MATSRRIQRFSSAIHKRQIDLVVALDQVHDRHNVSAVLRTADAVGIPEVIWRPDINGAGSPNPEVAQGAERWVSFRSEKKFGVLLKKYKEKGFRIAATHLGSASVDFRSIDWTKPWVVVMGNERRGCSEEVLKLADENILLPMVGLVQSLNVSVATAVILYEIQRCREKAGFYNRRQPRKIVEKLYNEWELEKEGITLSDVLHPSLEDLSTEDPTHVDGRNLFAKKLREKKQKVKI